jgi:ferrous-iron efflux pump FieF
LFATIGAHLHPRQTQHSASLRLTPLSAGSVTAPLHGKIEPVTATTRTEERARWLRWATSASVATAIALGLSKLVAWWLSGSVSVLASMVDSALDGSASLLNALAVRYAMKPADDEHLFGHGKSEALAGLAQALLISVSGAFILQHAVGRLDAPVPLESTVLSATVMGISLAATISLVTFQSFVVRKTGSLAIKADAVHYMSDIASNLASLVAVVLAPLGWLRVDPIIGILIAMITLYSALRIGVDTLDVLMDRELPADAKQRIRGIVLAHQQARGVHELRTRRAGPSTLIQFHLELDGHMTVTDSNHVVHEIASQLTEEFPGADVLIHQDPAGGSVRPPPPPFR